MANNNNSFYDTYNKQIFAKITKRVEEKVDQIAHDHVENIKNFLLFRRYLEGENGSRYPRSRDGDKGKDRAGEPHSYTAWKMERKGLAHYELYNNHVNSKDGFAYPNVLAYGTIDARSVWVKSYLDGMGDGLKYYNGKLFSKQMPQGLTGYFDRQNVKFIQSLQSVDWNKK